MTNDQASCRSESEIYNDLREALSNPVDCSDTIDAITALVRQGRTSEALQKLEAAKREINSIFVSLFQMLTNEAERDLKQEMTIRELRIQVIQGAIRYAELNDDPEGIAIGQELLARETTLVSSSIAYLDSEG